MDLGWVSHRGEVLTGRHQVLSTKPLKLSTGVGSRAQQLRPLAALTEDPGSVSSLHMVVNSCL